MLSRIMGWVCVVGAVGCVVLATRESLRSSGASESEPIVVVNGDQDVGEVPVGSSPVRLWISNPGPVDGEIISVFYSCGKNCCCNPNVPPRTPIAAGQVLEFVGELRVMAAGPFEFRTTAHLNDRGVLKMQPVRITGIAVAPPTGESDAKP
ncbi:hypothetical protein [Tuwongella immobilis]|uniref:DUF1573 domain-containing protein n=1 Tax=Tuwongella immobilis TaxID=692036 RepID=A0A6C2YV93_9BACT|nr:hypothetical protein [Tuwongella immobilis]VIP05530.1 unnamed protein product [Tuwongella immobilis]VTS08416.1 unnamed protein product [Tuwongella immobilis]